MCALRGRRWISCFALPAFAGGFHPAQVRTELLVYTGSVLAPAIFRQSGFEVIILVHPGRAQRRDFPVEVNSHVI